MRLGAGSGVGRASDSLLRAVSAKARGTMRTLDVSGLLGRVAPVVSLDAVVAVCAANVDTLEAIDARCDKELNNSLGFYYLEHDMVARLLASAPRLLRLDVDLLASPARAQAMLCHAVVRVRRLAVNGFDGPAAVVALVSALVAHPSVTQLLLSNAPLNAAFALESVVGFAVERRLCAVGFYYCALGVGSVPALTRLLEQGAGLTTLTIYNSYAGLSVSTAFCAALRACMLTRLELSACRLFRDPDGLALLAAVTTHPVLQHISLLGNLVAEDERPTVGAALGALMRSNAPALTSLDVSICNLRDEGLSPLVDALPGNTALRSLVIRVNGVTRPFGVALLTVVRANTSLRTLAANNETDDEVEMAGGEWQDPSLELAEAEALVAARI